MSNELIEVEVDYVIPCRFRFTREQFAEVEKLVELANEQDANTARRLKRDEVIAKVSRVLGIDIFEIPLIQGVVSLGGPEWRITVTPSE